MSEENTDIAEVESADEAVETERGRGRGMRNGLQRLANGQKCGTGVSRPDASLRRKAADAADMKARVKADQRRLRDAEWERSDHRPPERVVDLGGGRKRIIRGSCGGWQSRHEEVAR